MGSGWFRPAVAAAVLLGALLTADSSVSSRPRPELVVRTVPPVARLGQSARVSIHGFDRWETLEIRLVGSTTAIGLISPWIALRKDNETWSGVITPLESRGVYPIEIRQRPGAGILRANGWLFRVFASGTLSRRSFATPEHVAADWVSRRGTVVAMRRWRLPAFDRRLASLHQVVAVAYTPIGHASANDRLGIFVTAVRTSFGGPWRFLEAKVAP